MGLKGGSNCPPSCSQALLLDSALAACSDASKRVALIAAPPSEYVGFRRRPAVAPLEDNLFASVVRVTAPRMPPSRAPATAAAAAAPSPDSIAAMPDETDWERLEGDLSALRNSVDLHALAQQPNLRAMRLFLAERYVSWRLARDGSGDDEAAVFVALDAMQRDPDPLIDWRATSTAFFRPDSATEGLGRPPPEGAALRSSVPPFPFHHWPDRATAPVASGSRREVDPDCWFRLLWWLLRSVRCDFEPVLRWHELPVEVRDDETIGMAVRLAARAAGRGLAGPPPLPSSLSSPHGVLAFKIVPHHSPKPLLPSSTAALSGGAASRDTPSTPTTASSMRSWWGQHFSAASPPSPAPGASIATSSATASICRPIQLYHGSPLPCWHSVLRSGLQPLSRTAHMRHGAAYGEGVYLATQFATAWTYSAGAGGIRPVRSRAADASMVSQEHFTPLLVVSASPGAHLARHAYGPSAPTAPPVPVIAWTSVSTGATTVATPGTAAAAHPVTAGGGAPAIYVCNKAEAMTNAYLLLTPHELAHTAGGY